MKPNTNQFKRGLYVNLLLLNGDEVFELREGCVHACRSRMSTFKVSNVPSSGGGGLL
jgi:hypothetical protein